MVSEPNSPQPDDAVAASDSTALGESDSAPPPKKLPVLPIGIGAVVLAAGGFLWWQQASRYEQTNDAQVTANLYQISSRIPGVVQRVAVEDNQAVQKGAVLITLDPKDYQVKVNQAHAALEVASRQDSTAQASVDLAAANAQAALTQAQGNLNQAQAAIANAQAALTAAQEGVSVAQAQQATAKANLDKAKTDFDRYQSLYEAGAVSAQQRDTYKNGYEVAQQQWQAAQQEVQQAQAKVTEAQGTLNQAQAQRQASQGGIQKANAADIQTDVNQDQSQVAAAEINQAQATLEEAKLQLSYTKITAPVTGEVAQKNVETGEQIQAGQALMAIVGPNPWVIANFKETQVARMQAGEPVSMAIDAFPGQKFTGTVTSLSPGTGSEFALLPPDNATGNFTKVTQRVPVKIEFDPQSIADYASRIVPGMSVNVSVKVK